MAKRGGATYMTTLERVLGGVLLAVYLLAPLFATQPLFAMLERLMGRSISPQARSCACYCVLFGLALLIFWNYIGRTTGYFLSSTAASLATLGMGLVAFYGINELACRMFRLVLAGQTNLNDVAVSAQVRDAPQGAFLVIVFLAPFVEEVLFRGYVFGNLRQRSRTAAYLVSCLLFALLHVWQFAAVERSLASFLLMMQYLAPAAVLAWTYERSGTLWGSILLHCFANAMAVWGAV